MNWTKATETELYTIVAWDEEATLQDKWEAAQEIVRRQNKKRKPYRNNQQKIRVVAPKW